MSGTSAPPVQVRSGRRATRTGLSGSVQRAVDLAVPCVLVLLALLLLISDRARRQAVAPPGQVAPARA